MAVYYGNKKIDRIYVGGTQIGKVYYGSTQVFDNSRTLPAYGYENRYLVGNNSTSGFIIYPSLSTLSAISGTLGTSGSKVTITNSTIPDGNDEYSYYKTITLNGVKVHLYAIIPANMHLFIMQYVIEDAKIGSKCGQFQGYTDYPNNPTECLYYPASVGSNSFSYVSGGTAWARVAANDTNYTRNGFKS